LSTGRRIDSHDCPPSDQPKHLETERSGQTKNDDHICLEDEINNFNFDAFFDFDPAKQEDELDSACDSEVKYTLFIAEDKLKECPRISVRIGDVMTSAVLDLGCELILVSEELYNRIKQQGHQYLELPAQHLALVSAFNDKSIGIKRHAMLPIEIGTVTIDYVNLICPLLLTQVILGVDLFKNYDAFISFPERCLFMKISDELVSHKFEDERETTPAETGSSVSGDIDRDVCLTDICSSNIKLQ
jgi:hypothetical protein